MTLGTTHNRRDTGNQLILVERLGKIVIGTVTERLHLGFDVRVARKDHHRRVHTAHTELFEHFVAGDIWQRQVEYDHVVFVDLAEIDTFFTKISSVDIEASGLQHQLD